MPALLAPLLIWVLSSAIARVFVALGIGLFTYTGIKSLVEFALDQATQFVGQLPSAVLDLIALAGVDQAISIIGSALLTRAAITAARISVGLSV
ncbi:DUF2523 domain-containing protein [Halopseudomonas pachastrellae]|nr:DUF2523 domain-containing protein [Halopseudomonas pachastrellae]MEB3736232.1 DUF2523 domain-containing protein [Halopseudomonas pachastrellae]MEB3736239.1 DUF2523 domain-containing protein [Halopseudomonas pachastrellae]|tara:strand:+ start:4193 stop:4474 length:282 start_codon:yes stop_codon:yes gene_type:complete